jgi:hypothetical protein
MKVLLFIDKLFNAYYNAKKDYINFIHPKIFYTDWKIKGTIKSSFINGKRIIYPEPINYNELKEILIKKQNIK